MLERNIMSDAQSSAATQQIHEVLRKIGETLNGRSILILIALIALAAIIGRILAVILRRIVTVIGRRADSAKSVNAVNRLRRYETIIVMSIAVARVFLFMLALYMWWIVVHPGQQPTAIVGASAVFIVIAGGVIGPVLRDISIGSVMMSEQWYAVGDHIKVEPFWDVQGVVERVTLRSTRLRALNGEVTWISNQNIQGVHITPKSIRAMGVELFVKDLEKGEELIERANQSLPMGQLLVVSPLTVISSSKVGNKLWHITAVAETAPGREWLIEQFAVKVLKEIDTSDDMQVLAHDPVARFADTDAERKFTRTISNARKPRVEKRRMQRMKQMTHMKDRGDAVKK
jgi:hypothetical protein